MNPVRIILNKIKWTGNLEEAEIYFVDRENVMRKLDASKIKDLGESFVIMEDTMIPYHRIVKIIFKDQVLYQRFFSQ